MDEKGNEKEENKGAQFCSFISVISRNDAHKNSQVAFYHSTPVCLKSLYSVLFSRYGVIRSAGEPELQPLDEGDEEDEDMTLFDKKTAKWPK